MNKYLSQVNSPEDLKKLNIRELNVLALEIRKFLVDNVSSTGGHLASNLGAVELSIAMHWVYNSPKDRFIWDVGHQAYVHKILTGRKDRFSTLRRHGGLSGFPKRSESPHDHFDTGHSSTSVSAATGYAMADKISGGPFRENICVIGDGALTGGMAYEALNHLGSTDLKVLIILNDNGMSISRNVGAIVNSFRASKGYNTIKSTTKNTINKIPVIGSKISDFVSQFKDGIRASVIGRGQLFEELGLRYIGPIDGHNIADLVSTLERIKHLEGPVILHIKTVKGKGYNHAESLPVDYHGVSKFDPSVGISKKTAAELPANYSAAFGNALCRIATKDDRAVAISAAMIDGTGLSDFADKFPGRMYDVAIAEQHAVTFAAALALSGVRPFCAIYSTFLQRAYDQIIHDVALQNAPVIFCIDRAGVVGADGETHHGIFDLAMLTAIPNLEIISVSSYMQLERAVEYAKDKLTGPTAIRYPRGAESEILNCEEIPKSADCQGKLDPPSTGFPDDEFLQLFTIWEPEDRCENPAPLSHYCIVTHGRMTDMARLVSNIHFDGQIDVLSTGRVSPLSARAIMQIRSYKKIVILDDQISTGGFFAAIRENAATGTEFITAGYKTPPGQGSTMELMDEHGLSHERLAKRISDKWRIG